MASRPTYAVNYIPQLQARGMSANQALSYLREQGLGIRRQTFLRAWGETRARIDKREAVQQARVDRRPLADEVTRKTTVRATGFEYQVSVAVRDRLSGEVYFTPSGFKADRLVTFDKALQGALEALQTAQVDQGSLPGEQILGGVVDSVLELTPADDEGDLF